MSAITLLYLARHGSTILNQSNSFRGNKDVPLAPEGIQDARRLALFFKNEPISFIVSSDKQRAWETARILKGEHQVPAEITPSLRALNVGDFSGQKRSPENVAALQQYLDDPDCCIPGGESLNEFRGRIQPAIWEAIEISDESGLPGVLVCHSSVVHEASNMIMGNHTAVLVKPGGVAAVYISDGKLGMQAVYKPLELSAEEQGRADTIS